MIIEKINVWYERIRQQIVSDFGAQIKCNLERQINKENCSFSITLEIVIVSEQLNDDYGIVLATNAQPMSHFNSMLKNYDGGLFLLSDLSSGVGKILESTDEFLYFPFDTQSQIEMLEHINKFLGAVLLSVNQLLIENYKIDKNYRSL